MPPTHIARTVRPDVFTKTEFGVTVGKYGIDCICKYVSMVSMMVYLSGHPPPSLGLGPARPDGLGLGLGLG